MASLYLLIPVSLIFCALAVWLYFWAVNSGQYDDLEGEADRILFEEDDDQTEDGNDQNAVPAPRADKKEDAS